MIGQNQNRQEASITWCDLFWPKFGQKMISLHDVLEPLKQALFASRDVINSSQICGSNLQTFHIWWRMLAAHKRVVLTGGSFFFQRGGGSHWCPWGRALGSCSGGCTEYEKKPSSLEMREKSKALQSPHPGLVPPQKKGKYTEGIAKRQENTVFAISLFFCIFKAQPGFLYSVPPQGDPKITPREITPSPGRCLPKLLDNNFFW